MDRFAVLSHHGVMAPLLFLVSCAIGQVSDTRHADRTDQGDDTDGGDGLADGDLAGDRDEGDNDSTTGDTDANPGDVDPDPCVSAGTCPVGEWYKVTPNEPGMQDLVEGGFGMGGIVGDPARPTDLYTMGGDAGLWKSTDYGATWHRVNDDFGYVAHGVNLAVAGTQPKATVWVAQAFALFKSTNGGESFSEVALSSPDPEMDLYSLVVDPYDPTHLLSGSHERDGVFESSDGGTTWVDVARTGEGWPSDGESWFPFFIDTGSASSTRSYWLAIGQGAGAPLISGDGGAHWYVPDGLDGVSHPHGNSQIHQAGGTLYVTGGDEGTLGVFRSTNILSADPEDVSFQRVDDGEDKLGLVWGTSKGLYAMYGWACGTCELNTHYKTSPASGSNWTLVALTHGLTNGPNGVVVTSDGTNNIFVASMWNAGLWRFIEP